MRNFKELQVWQKSHRVVIEVYRITKAFPYDERFGLVSQIRRSAASVPANIAEGCGRGSDRDFARFLSIAAGSASETQYHLLLARDLQLLGENDYMKIDRNYSGAPHLHSFLPFRIAPVCFKGKNKQI